jgi:hypothetical protein
MPVPLPRKPPSLRDRDPSDPARRAVELAQRGRMILDVATADLEAAETTLGPFHPTSWHFRNALHEARRSWDRLRAEFGGSALDAALNQPPLAVLTLGDDRRGTPPIILIPIGGRTYRALRVAGTPLAPVQWRLSRLLPPDDDGPYYACRLSDGSTQCDCAEWTYQIADIDPHGSCKHLAALAELGWI